MKKEDKDAGWEGRRKRREECGDHISNCALLFYFLSFLSFQKVSESTCHTPL